MWRLLGLLTGIAAAGATVAVMAFASCGGREGEPFELVTTSPANTYQAQFAERGQPQNSASSGRGRHEVRFTVSKGNIPIVENEPVYEGGVYDDRFSELFPEHGWVSDSLLRFGRKGSPQAQHDEVLVSNETDRPVTYLWVNAGKYEMYLILELRPQSSVTLRVQPQTDEGMDFSYIGCKGRFRDGRAIAEAAGNFIKAPPITR
jgi:hypothetical protein